MRVCDDFSCSPGTVNAIISLHEAASTFALVKESGQGGYSNKHITRELTLFALVPVTILEPVS